MARRTKLIYGLSGGLLALIVALFFGLNKTGYIPLKSLADEVAVGLKQISGLDKASEANANVSITVTRSDGLPADGSRIYIYQKSNESNDIGRAFGEPLAVSNGKVIFSVPTGFYYDLSCSSAECMAVKLNIKISVGTANASETFLLACTAGRDDGERTSCSATLPCSAGQSCNNGVCQADPNYCVASNTCSAGQWCGSNHQCTSSCTGTGQSTCPAGFACSSGTCASTGYPRCTSDSACSAAAGETCQNNTCSKSCSASSICPSNFSCINNQCSRNKQISFHGKVVKPDGSPFEGVEVNFRVSGGHNQNVRTDANGYYTITNFPMVFDANNASLGSYYFGTFDYAGYNRAEKNLAQLGTSTVRVGANYSLNNVAMQANTTTAVLSGRIMDENQQPLPDIKIKLSSPNGFSKDKTSEKTWYYPAGIPAGINYEIRDIPRPANSNTLSYSVTFENVPDNFVVSGDKTILVQNGSALINRDFTFRAKRSVNFDWVGLIKDSSNNQPVSDIPIWVYKNGNGAPVQQSATTTVASDTITDGQPANFTLRNLPAPNGSERLDIVVGLKPNGEAFARYSIGSSDIVLGTNGKHDFVRKDSAVEVTAAAKITVKDYAPGNTPLEGADVEISDNNCPSFNALVKKTNGQGEAIFFTDAISNYREMTDCLLNLYVSVSKNGYVSQLLSLSLSNEDTVFLKKITSPQNSNGKITGHVYTADSQPLQGVKVNLCQPQQEGCSSPSIVTGVSGEFSFASVAPGAYVANAFHLNYADSPRSNIHFNYRTGAMDIALYLGDKLPDKNSLAARVLVLEQGTNQPLRGIALRLKDTVTGQTQTLPATDWYGMTHFQALTQRNYLLSGTGQININGKESTYSVDESPIEYPANYNSLGGDDLKAANSRALLYATILSNPSFFPVIKVSDCSSKAPIAGAKIHYSLDYPADIWNVFDLSSISGELQTGSNGSVAMSNRFSKASSLNLKISASGFIAKEKSGAPQEELLVCLENQANAKHIIQISGHEDKDLIVQRKQTGSWIDRSDIVIRDSNFTPPSNGTYRVKDTKTTGVSTSVDFTNTDDLSITYEICDITDPAIDQGQGIFFVLDGQARQDYDDPAKKLIFSKIAQQVAILKNSSVNIGKVLIAFNSSSEVNAAANPTLFSECGGVYDVSLITLNYGNLSLYYQNIITDNELLSTVTHEYGHLVSFQLERISNPIDSLWKALYLRLKNDPVGTIVFNRITDGNVQRSIGGFYGHPQDNASELFASFFNAYYMHHPRLLEIIQNGTEGAAQNVLSYMWRLFVENVGKTGAADGALFSPIGGSVTEAGYSFDQLRSGVWRTDVYNRLNLSEKASVQYSRVVQPLASQTRLSVLAAINRLNRIVDNLLAVVGLSARTGSASLTVLDKNNKPVNNAIVQVGMKAGLTGANGKVIISNIPAGWRKISPVQISGRDDKYGVTKPLTKSINVRVDRNVVSTVQIEK